MALYNLGVSTLKYTEIQVSRTIIGGIKNSLKKNSETFFQYWEMSVNYLQELEKLDSNYQEYVGCHDNAFNFSLVVV